MQATARLHEAVATAVRQEAYLLFHHPTAFHAANGRLKADSDRRDRPIARLLRGRECPPRRFLRRLDDGESVEEKALDAPVLIETPPVREGIAFECSSAFSMGLPFLCGTQETTVTACLDHEEVLDRVARLLAAIVFLLVLGSGRALDRSLSAIMPKRGGCGTPPVLLAASMTAHSLARRAGRSS